MLNGIILHPKINAMAKKLDKVVELNAIQWDCLKVKTFKKKKGKRNNQRITISFSHTLKWPFIHSSTDTNWHIDEYIKSNEMEKKRREKIKWMRKKKRKKKMKMFSPLAIAMSTAVKNKRSLSIQRRTDAANGKTIAFQKINPGVDAGTKLAKNLFVLIILSWCTLHSKQAWRISVAEI